MGEGMAGEVATTWWAPTAECLGVRERSMRILMLGWEFPPFIAGGLGVACYGLTKALDRLGHEIIFVLPKAVDRSHGSHVKLLSPGAKVANLGGAAPGAGEGLTAEEMGTPLYGFQHTVFRGVTASFSNPYPGFDARRFARLVGPEALDPATGRADAGSAEALQASLEEIRKLAPAGDRKSVV